MLALRSLQLESSSANWKTDEKGRMQLEFNEELMASCSCVDDVPLALINEYTTSLMHCASLEISPQSRSEKRGMLDGMGEVWRGMGHILSAFQATCTIKTHRSACRFGSRPVHAMIIDPWPWWQQNQVILSCLFMSLISIEHYWTVWLVGTSLKFWSVALYDLSIMNYLCGRPRQSKPLLCSLSFMTWVSPSPEWKSVEPQESGKSNQKDLAGVKTSLESSWIYSNPMHSMHINAR